MNYIKTMLLIGFFSLVQVETSNAQLLAWLQWPGSGSAGTISPQAMVCFDEEDLNEHVSHGLCSHESCRELERIATLGQDEFDAYLAYKRLEGCPWWQRFFEKLLLKMMGIKEQ